MSGTGIGTFSRGVFQYPDVFVATAMKLGWFPESVFRDLIQLIGSYTCRFGMGVVLMP